MRHSLPIFSFSEKDADNYDLLKTDLFARCRLFSTQFASEFYKWAYEPHVTIRAQLYRVSQIAIMWLQVELLTPFKVAEKVPMDYVLCSLPKERT